MFSSNILHTMGSLLIASVIIRYLFPDLHV